MIPTTEPAKPAPRRAVRSALASSTWAWAGPSVPASMTGISDVDPPGGGDDTRRLSWETANGITASDANGATAMPSATTPSPEPIPTATASGNAKREVDSRNTSAP